LVRSALKRDSGHSARAAGGSAWRAYPAAAAIAARTTLIDA
jgi:hypothetical protein